MSCPSHLILETALLAPNSPSVPTAHIENCPQCQARLEAMRAQDTHFRQYVFPSTLDGVLGSQRPWRWWHVASPLALVAVLLVVFVPRSPTSPRSDDLTQLKGGDHLTLEIFTPTADGATELHDGDGVSASASLRFKVSTTRPCHLSLVSLDSEGTLSPLYPATRLTGGGQALPGGVILDGHHGPERFFALCANDPLSLPQLVDMTRALDVKALASLTRLPLPATTLQTTVVLNKN